MFSARTFIFAKKLYESRIKWRLYRIFNKIGKHKISFYSKLSNLTVTSNFRIILSQEILEYPLIQTKFPKNLLHDNYCPSCKKEITEEDQKICEFCGGELIGKRV